ncbi:hypothetical protein ASPVEDRAFT_44940 [Aspergillus versicolor CBS 583.65]|uniref:Uncharacterized protein n=1 Tax=Aspergillus versicolor CBS 583.65 TaxID=1036611 RepID=A0A1L9PVE2_ASPVE|nr:uncharacterized protein ASPVEDRAFT_44940 [Aspergillus versicolor CBS 583.65]OJJ05443.1 hypothetical protein ASPVEDRAFT_44940 [Aspergillus versicolor CBS 583.65]
MRERGALIISLKSLIPRKFQHLAHSRLAPSLSLVSHPPLPPSPPFPRSYLVAQATWAWLGVFGVSGADSDPLGKKPTVLMPSY